MTMIAQNRGDLSAQEPQLPQNFITLLKQKLDHSGIRGD